jgi:hypothetical protein
MLGRTIPNLRELLYFDCLIDWKNESAVLKRRSAKNRALTAKMDV